MRRFVAAGLVAIAAGAGVVLGLAWLAARSLVMPVRRPLPRTPADLGLAFESLELAGADGIRLASWWIAADRPRATAVLVHGFRSTRNELLDHAPALRAIGLDVVLYDARACGQSGGALSTMGWREQEDLRAVIDQVASRTDGRPVVVMGHSLGAATAILEGADDARVIAFVLEAPFTAIDDVVGRSFRHFTRPHLPAFPFAPLTVRLAEARVGQHRSVGPTDRRHRPPGAATGAPRLRPPRCLRHAGRRAQAGRSRRQLVHLVVDRRSGPPGRRTRSARRSPRTSSVVGVVDLVEGALARQPAAAAPDPAVAASQSAAPPPTTGSSVT